MHGGVFINYRGEDSRSYGALLYAELSRRLGPHLVFLDSESIPPGTDYVDRLLGMVRASRVVLAVIGPRWLAPGGRSPIDDPADWVRRELVEAFRADVRVIPILTDDAEMPTEDDLPSVLAPLSRCQFRRLRHRDASIDLARLAADLADIDPYLRTAATQLPAPAGWPVHPAAGSHLPDQPGEFQVLPDKVAWSLVATAMTEMAEIAKTALAVLAVHELTADGRRP